ncbi:MAG: class I SAM-dependent methyltransferase [Gammaproteobacteria bacterium]|nr:class I SAM-dependent methyltransferase [Gammaproteobacteria bacterium]
MKWQVEWIDKKFYAEFQSNWDDKLFREQIVEHLNKPLDVLDLGAGAGIVSQMNFKGIAGHVCGIDPDERVVTNPYLDEGKVAFGEKVPYPDESFDLIFADNVLEHLPQPGKVFYEVYRLLRPGGVFLSKTPNKLHYMPLIARLTPHRFHQWINKWRGRVGEDVFPTRYQANSTGDIRKLAKIAGLEVNRLDLIEGRPEYLRMSFLTYIPGLLYERLVNRFGFLARYRILLIVELRKPESR